MIKKTTMVMKNLRREFMAKLDPNPFDFIKNLKINKPKILGVWDFYGERTGQCGLGDILIFNQILNVFSNMNKNKSSRIDIAFINEPKLSNKNDIRYKKTYLWKKTQVLASRIFNDVNSVLFFNSRSDFKKYIQQNKDDYYIWSLNEFKQVIDLNIIEQYFDVYNKIPSYKIDSEIKRVIYKFYDENIGSALPIVINFRSNTRSKHRNSNPSEIGKFLKKMESNKKYKFIIVAQKNEVPPEYRKLSNVLISKDYFDSVEYDCALVDTSYFSIFPSSGLAIVAYFSNVPFLQYGLHDLTKGTSLLDDNGNVSRLNFLKDYQLIYHQNENLDFLVGKFDYLSSYLEEKGINNYEDKKENFDDIYRSEF